MGTVAGCGPFCGPPRFLPRPLRCDPKPLLACAYNFQLGPGSALRRGGSTGVGCGPPHALEYLLDTTRRPGCEPGVASGPTLEAFRGAVRLSIGKGWNLHISPPSWSWWIQASSQLATGSQQMLCWWKNLTSGGGTSQLLVTTAHFACRTAGEHASVHECFLSATPCSHSWRIWTQTLELPSKE